MPNSFIIVGVGNVLFKDERIGVYAARYLEQNYTFTPEVNVIDGATLGFSLMTYFQEYEKVVIIDTVSIDDKAGSIYRLPAQEMLGLGSYRQTAHEVEIVEMLEICSLLEKMAEVVIIGIVPKDIKSIDISLTQELQDVFIELIETILLEVKDSAIRYEKTGSKTLLEIIEQTIQH